MNSYEDIIDNIIDVRDIMARVEELEEDRDDVKSSDELIAWDQSKAGAERVALLAILEDIKGYGGDEQWRGDWYPVTLIRDSYFKEYAQYLAEDIGAINPNATWPNNCIDWDHAARELQMDYTSTDIDGITYWMR